MEDRPSQGMLINTQAWLDAWACIFAPIFLGIVFLLWPLDIFGFGDSQ
jgi:hypothetical protein